MALATDRDALPALHSTPAFRAFTVFAAVWMTVVLGLGFLGDVSNLPILEHTARNLYFHVPMWFTMMLGWFVVAYQSLRHLTTGRRIHDVRAEQAAYIAFLFGILGFVTGTVWARFTWYVGTNIWYNADPRQVMVVVQLLITGAYFVLRDALGESRQRGRLTAVYALFATVTMPFLMYVLPRRMDSLHPGAEGNPAFSQMDIAPEMRWVFYSAVIGFMLLFAWMYHLRVRMRVAELRTEERTLAP